MVLIAHGFPDLFPDGLLNIVHQSTFPILDRLQAKLELASEIPCKLA